MVRNNTCRGLALRIAFGITLVLLLAGGADAAGDVYTWGSNTAGQLGDGTNTRRSTPAQVSGLTGITAIAAGYYHTIALKSDGTVWTWGQNNYGQIGDGTTTDRWTPVKVSGLTGVTAIAGGGLHTIALKSDGTVWTWGANGNGQLGDGTQTQRLTPVQVSGLNGVTAIAGGFEHTIVLRGSQTTPTPTPTPTTVPPTTVPPTTVPTTTVPPVLAQGDTWTTKSAMPTARSDPYAASIGGLLYVVGGNDGSGATNKVEAYNPATDAWATLAPIPHPVYQGTIGVIDGKLYVVGGWDYPISGIPIRTLQIYNPASNTWSNGAVMPILNGCSVAGVINRKLYVLTACDGYSGYRKYLHEYNPDTNSWTEKAQPPNTHAYGAGGVIDGKFYVAGGQDGSGTIVTAMLDVYDPATNTWTTKASMPTARGGASAGVINGQLYVIGGWSTTNPLAVLATLEVYDPATNTWTTKTSISRARYALAADVIDGKLYAVGGYDSAVSAKLEVYTPPTTATILGTWENPEGNLTLYENGRFVGNDVQIGDFNGTYTTQGNILTFNYVFPTEVSLNFTFVVSGNTLQLSLSLPEVFYTRVGATTANIIGTWQYPKETITLYGNGQFTGNNVQIGTFNGTYTTQGNVLTLNYVFPNEASLNFTFVVSGDTLQLTLRLPPITYTRVKEDFTVSISPANMIVYPGA